MSITLAEVLEENPLTVNLLLSGVSAGEAGAVILQQHITKHPKLQILELRGSTVGPGGCSRLARALHEHPCIRHVGLARNGLDMGSCMELINSLSTCRMLQSLDLEWDSIDDQCAVVLAKWLNQLDCTLVALNLERNFITKSGATALARAISNNKTLKNLNIGHMRCESEAAIEWGKMLSANTSLATLNMSGTELLTDSTKHILLGLRGNPSVKALSLQYCQGLTALSEIANEMQFSIQLKELNLQGSRAAPNEAAARGFALAIQKATGLIGLNISRCVVSDAAMNQMLKGVSLIMSLQVFDVSACGVSDASMQAMAQVLDRCINIHTLCLDDNHLGPRGGQLLADGVAKASALVSLSLTNCDLRNPGIIALANVIRKRQLACLKVGNNGFDIDGGKALIHALLEDPRYNILREFDISHNRLTGRFSVLLGLLFKRHTTLMPVCVRGTTISQAVQEAYVDAASIRISADIQRKSEDELNDGTFVNNTTYSSKNYNNTNTVSPTSSGAKNQHQQDDLFANTSSTILVTNFQGASPNTRALPSAVRSSPSETTKRVIQYHKDKGSWIDSEFGETINQIINSTTNFRTSSSSTSYAGDDNNSMLALTMQNAKGTLRAQALSGAAKTSAKWTENGNLNTMITGGEQYRLPDEQQQQNDGMSSALMANLPSAAARAINNLVADDGDDDSSSNRNNNNIHKTSPFSRRNQMARELLLSQTSPTGTTPSTKNSIINNNKNSLHQQSSKQQQGTSSNEDLQMINSSNNNNNHHNSSSSISGKTTNHAGGFLHAAGLAPRTDPSPMWARRPQTFDLEASVGESLCVSEPQLKLAFMELDKERTGLLSRQDVEDAYRKFCIDFDPNLDKKKLNSFFEKYGNGGIGRRGKNNNNQGEDSDGGGGGKIGYDAFCMLMLSLVNR